MHAEEVRQTQKTPAVGRPRTGSSTDVDPQQRRTHRMEDDGLSLSRQVQSDVEGSLGAVGTVCRTVTLGLVATGAGAIVTLMTMLLF